MQEAAADANVLDRPSVERVRRALRGFRPSLGLGVDCINPRSFDLLDDDFVERLIDLMMMWEADPLLSTRWPSLMVFSRSLTARV